VHVSYHGGELANYSICEGRKSWRMFRFVRSRGKLSTAGQTELARIGEPGFSLDLRRPAEGAPEPYRQEQVTKPGI
jgi:hypothetical protein